MLERYKSILDMVRKLCPTAHIGGGAVRDSLLERPIRDIDLFLDDAATDEAAKRLRSQFSFVKVGEWKSYEMFSDPAVARVARFEKADETIPVCLIGLKEPRDMKANVARFDFGICMAAWAGGENTQLSVWSGGGERIYTAPEHKTDLERKTFTLCRADDQAQFNYSMSRFDKMTADRFAGWQLVVPKKFERMAKEHALRKTHYYDDATDMWKLRDYGQQVLTPKAR